MATSYRWSSGSGLSVSRGGSGELSPSNCAIGQAVIGFVEDAREQPGGQVRADSRVSFPASPGEE